MTRMTSNAMPHTKQRSSELAGMPYNDTSLRGPAGGSPPRRIIGAAWIAGGALWVAGGLLYADSGWRFGVSSLTWLAADLFLVAGLIGLWFLRPHGSSRPAAVALAMVLAGRVLFASAEVGGFVAGTEIETLLPIAALLTAVSSIAYGTLARLADRRFRASSIAMGLYFFVAMMPFLAITGEPNSLAIAGWGIPAVLIGLAVGGGGRQPAAEGSPTTRS